MAERQARWWGLVVAGIALAAGGLTLNRALVGVFYDPWTPAAVHYPPLYPLHLAPLFGTLSVARAALAAKVLNVVQQRLAPAEHRAYLERMGVTHVLLLADPGHGSAQELDTLLGAYPGWLTIMQGWRDGRAGFVVNRER